MARVIKNISLDIREFGAVPDGATDSTAAIQKAFDAAGDTTGSVVVIPAGEFVITAPLVVNKYINVDGIPEQSRILNKYAGHAMLINSTCTISGVTIVGSVDTGSALYLNSGANFSHCTLSGNGRYGVEFSSVVHIVSTHFEHCTIAQNKLGGVYSVASDTSQKNLAVFRQCYIVGNGLTDQGTTPNGATPDTGHGFYIEGGIAWSIIGCVTEANSGAGILVTGRPNYGIYGLTINGCHLESNMYANIYVKTPNSSYMTDLDINGNYYFNLSDHANSLIQSRGKRTIVDNFQLMANSSIDKTFDSDTITAEMVRSKRSLKIGGEFESIKGYLPYTNSVVSNDPLSGGYNILRLDTAHGINFMEPVDFATYVDPRLTYRLVYEFRYKKSISSSAALYMLQLDKDKNQMGLAPAVAQGLFWADEWITVEQLITPAMMDTNTRYLQFNTSINYEADTDYLLFRKVLIYPVDSVVAPSGTTANRPIRITSGYMYFDTDLNKPVWWNGTEWRDASGSIV